MTRSALARVASVFSICIIGLATMRTAFADTAVCTGTLTTVANHANGVNGLYVVVGSSNVVRVCSFTATQYTVTPEDCKHMASLAALAFATDASVVFYIDNAPTSACSSVPSWFGANTRYFALQK